MPTVYDGEQVFFAINVAMGQIWDEMRRVKRRSHKSRQKRLSTKVFFLSVLASLVAAALGITTEGAVEKYIIPFLQSLTYRGPDVSGKWAFSATAHNGSEILVATVELVQKGFCVRGTMTCTFSNEEDESVVILYEVRGSLWGSHLLFEALPLDGHFDSSIVGSLSIERAGGGLRGITVVTSPFASETLVSSDLTWNRH